MVAALLPSFRLLGPPLRIALIGSDRAGAWACLLGKAWYGYSMADAEEVKNILGVASAVAAWIGLIISVRREYAERIKLKFWFEVTDMLPYDSDGQEFYAQAVQITVTNIGARAISLDRLACTFYNLESQKRHREKRIKPVKVVRGEPIQEWLLLHDTPGRFVEVAAIDTTGKKRKPEKESWVNLSRHAQRSGRKVQTEPLPQLQSAPQLFHGQSLPFRFQGTDDLQLSRGKYFDAK